MLDVKALEKGDELVCIDPAGYLRQDPGGTHFRCQVLSMPIIFNGIREGKGLILTNEPYLIPFGALKFFTKKSKEVLMCDFNALIDVAHKALNDGLIENYCVSKDAVNICTSLDEFLLKVRNNEKSITEAIEAIQSLYKETFVIECEEDINRVKKGAEIALLNGNKSTVIRVDDDCTLKVKGWDYFLQFFTLKGATVEQPK